MLLWGWLLSHLSKRIFDGSASLTLFSRTLPRIRFKHQLGFVIFRVHGVCNRPWKNKKQTYFYQNDGPLERLCAFSILHDDCQFHYSLRMVSTRSQVGVHRLHSHTFCSLGFSLPAKYNQNFTHDWWHWGVPAAHRAVPVPSLLQVCHHVTIAFLCRTPKSSSMQQIHTHHCHVEYQACHLVRSHANQGGRGTAAGAKTSIQFARRAYSVNLNDFRKSELLPQSAHQRVYAKTRSHMWGTVEGTWFSAAELEIQTWFLRLLLCLVATSHAKGAR